MPGLKKKRGVEAGRSLSRGGGAEPPPFANGSNTTRNTNLFIVKVVPEEVVVVVVEEGIVGFEPGLNLGLNLGQRTWLNLVSVPGLNLG